MVHCSTTIIWQVGNLPTTPYMGTRDDTWFKYGVQIQDQQYFASEFVKAIIQVKINRTVK